MIGINQYAAASANSQTKQRKQLRKRSENNRSGSDSRRKPNKTARSFPFFSLASSVCSVSVCLKTRFLWVPKPSSRVARIPLRVADQIVQKSGGNKRRKTNTLVAKRKNPANVQPALPDPEQSSSSPENVHDAQRRHASRSPTSQPSRGTIDPFNLLFQKSV